MTYSQQFDKVAAAFHGRNRYHALTSDMEDERIRKELLPVRNKIDYLDGIDIYLGAERIAWKSYEKVFPLPESGITVFEMLCTYVRVCAICGSACFRSGRLLDSDQQLRFKEVIKTAPKYFMCETCDKCSV